MVYKTEESHSDKTPLRLENRSWYLCQERRLLLLCHSYLRRASLEEGFLDPKQILERRPDRARRRDVLVGDECEADLESDEVDDDPLYLVG